MAGKSIAGIYFNTKKKPFDIKIDNNRQEPKLSKNVRYTDKQNYRRYKTLTEPKLLSKIMVEPQDSDTISLEKKLMKLMGSYKEPELQEYEKELKARLNGQNASVFTAENPFVAPPNPKEAKVYNTDEYLNMDEDELKSYLENSNKETRIKVVRIIVENAIKGERLSDRQLNDVKERFATELSLSEEEIDRIFDGIAEASAEANSIGQGEAGLEAFPLGGDDGTSEINEVTTQQSEILTGQVSADSDQEYNSFIAELEEFEEEVPKTHEVVEFITDSDADAEETTPSLLSGASTAGHDKRRRGRPPGTGKNKKH